ncbi:oxidoreductase [Hydrogenimonas cancrithermarum]|uniref:SDR family oxidoreductase n=1 Tax=Hydrogenimonas cancrithermarum TaxID=2993563 RepID=A0ABM8FNV3_9BACT|nr:oxidoreductase [Hydrogenimonas cancrithermarum]BDY13555.1 SDR family oxidoreductase [Hydrogenimonas cancrithermarum]
MLKDNVVVITGGAGLIGQEFVKAVVENEGTAIIADIDPARANEVKTELCEMYGTDRIDAVEMDITSKESLQKCLDYLSKKHGRIDALVNNAYPRNKNYGRHFFDVEYQDFVQNVGLNLGGYFLTSQQFANYFKRQGYGNIVNISSIYGVIPPKFEIYENTKMTMPVEYAAIKSALIHLTKYMAKYFKGLNIRVNAISPGGILDNQPEPFLQAYKEQCLSKGMLEKSDLKGTLIYLLSDMSRYVNGQNIVVDDGFSL